MAQGMTRHEWASDDNIIPSHILEIFAATAVTPVLLCYRCLVRQISFAFDFTIMAFTFVLLDCASLWSGDDKL